MIISLVSHGETTNGGFAGAVEFYVFRGIPDLSQYVLVVVTNGLRKTWQFPNQYVMSGSYLVVIGGRNPAQFTINQDVPDPAPVDNGIQGPGTQVFVVPFPIEGTSEIYLSKLYSTGVTPTGALDKYKAKDFTKGHSKRSRGSPPGKNRFGHVKKDLPPPWAMPACRGYY